MRPPALIQRFARRLRRNDAPADLKGLLPRIAAVPLDDATQWPDLQAAVASAAAGLAERDWLSMRLHDRVAAWLVAADRHQDLVTALIDRSEHGGSFATGVDLERGVVVARPGYLDRLGTPLPDWLLGPHDRDLPLVARLEGVTDDDGAHLRGVAFVRGITFEPERDSTRMWAVADSGWVELDVQAVEDRSIDSDSGDRWCSYARSGVRAVLDSKALDSLYGTVRIEVEVSAGPVRRRGVALTLDRSGRDLGAVLETADVVDGVLALTGRTQGVVPVAAVLTGRLRDLRTDVATADGRFDARIELAVSAWGRRVAPESGEYDLQLIEADGATHPVQSAPELGRVMPVEWMTPLVGARLHRTSNGLGLAMRSPLPVAERGRLHQRRLVESIWSAPIPLQEQIVATCFSGRSIGDSVEPLARELQSRLGWPAYWGVRDHSVAVPPGFEPLLIHSRQWHEALHSARLLLNNAHFPSYFRVDNGQTYVQTWHGTPLKKIGRDVPAAALSLSYGAVMAREATSWDLLLAQGPYAAELLPRALGYEGKVLAEGYPRDDVLRAPDAAERRRVARVQLGLADRQVALLYAPTWRDGVLTKEKGSALVSYLDTDLLRERLGGEVVVLLRGHSNTSRGRSSVAGPGIIDVTDHPDLSALYLAADVLVTDYSSVMFDFCVTGKPMAFLAPDLVDYRDSIRGFYLPLDEIAPGPVVASTDQLVDELADLPGLVTRYSERYATFVERFAPYDDGHATDRVVDALIKELGR